MTSLSFSNQKRLKPPLPSFSSSSKTSFGFHFLHKLTKTSLSKRRNVTGHHSNKYQYFKFSESPNSEKNNQQLNLNTTFKNILVKLPLELQLLVLKFVIVSNVSIGKYALLAQSEHSLIDLGVINVLSEASIDFTFPLREFKMYGSSKGIEYNTPNFQKFMAMVKRLDVKFGKAIINGSFYSVSRISEDTLWACDNCSKIEILFDNPKLQYDVMNACKNLNRSCYFKKLINTRVIFNNDMNGVSLSDIEQLDILKHIDIIVTEELSFKTINVLKYVAMKSSRTVTLILENSNFGNIPQNIIEFVDNLRKANPCLAVNIRLQDYWQNLQFCCNQEKLEFCKLYLTELKLRININSENIPDSNYLDLTCIKNFSKLKRLSIWIDAENYLKFKRFVVVKSNSLQYLNLESNDKYNFYSKFFKTRLDCPLLNHISTESTAI